MTTTIDLKTAYDELKARGLSLDLTRGKPSSAQLDLSLPLLSLPGPDDFHDAAGTDLRNYGGTDGLPELRAIFGDILGIPVAQLLALDTTSLPIMHDFVVNALLHGFNHGDGPWRNVDGVSFIFPVPGYDRHFAICEALGIRMISVPMVDGGLDLDTISALVASDASIRAIWVVPTYANPSGYSLTEAETRALVEMPTAAPDFRLLWDNAYVVHDLTETPAPVHDVLGMAATAGNADRPIVFASTSKITLPGGGVAFIGASPTNIAWIKERAFVRTIGPDKLNQLRHVRFLQDAAGVRAHMAAHRALLVPKFDAALGILETRLGRAATWSVPNGGYFISLDVGDGCASRAIDLAKGAGIAVTAAGAMFPYGEDPNDSLIRLAPTFPPMDELKTAIDGLCTCVLLAQSERDQP